MKSRKSLVSNSSSSSFIIAFAQNESCPCPTCGRKDPDLLEFIERASRTHHNTEIQCEDFIEVIEEIQESYSTIHSDDNDYIIRMHKEKTDLIDHITKIVDEHDDWAVIKCYVDNNDTMTGEIIETMSKAERLIIIQQQGC